MTRLGEMSGMLNGVVELLNDTDESDPEEIRRLHEMISELEPIIDNTIEEAETEPAGWEEPVPWTTRPPEPESVFVLTVTLKGIEPSIWRRVRLPGSCTLGDLHLVMHTVMDWGGDHLHEFVVNGRRYADTVDMDEPGLLDEEEVTLDDLGLAASSRLEYTYDFGDNWKHEIKVHRIVSADAFPAEERRAVVCVTGARAVPTVEYFADEFDPEESDPGEFDIDRVNAIFRGEPQW